MGKIGFVELCDFDTCTEKAPRAGRLELAFAGCLIDM